MYTLALLGYPGGNVDWTHSHHWFGCDFWRLTVWVPLFFKSPILITILSMLWDFPTNLIWEIQNPTEWNAVFQAIMLPSELGRNLSGIKGEGRRGSPWWISGLRSRREDWRSSRGQVWEMRLLLWSHVWLYSCSILVSLVWNANVIWVSRKRHLEKRF